MSLLSFVIQRIDKLNYNSYCTLILHKIGRNSWMDEGREGRREGGKDSDTEVEGLRDSG